MSTGSYITYQWNLNGAAISGATTPSHTITQAGIYTVTVHDANGCSGISAPYGITVGISANNIKKSVSIYPNPAQDQIIINAASPVTTHIFSIDGRLLLHTKSSTIDVSSLMKGIYLLHLTDEVDRLVLIEKMIKL